MNIVIFEDVREHQIFMMNTISKYIVKRRLNASIELITDNTLEMERYIENNQAYTLYFIDIRDKQGKLSGLNLSEKIRQKNNTDIIIFVTCYLKEVIFSTKHKIMALNIIAKNNKSVKQEICDTVEHAYSIMLTDSYFVLDNVNGDIFKAAFNDIYMIETVKGCHKVRIHYKNGVYECAGLLKEILPKLAGQFKRCHKSYIVNLDKIEQISKKKGEIVLNNGLKISYSLRYKINKHDYCDQIEP